MLSIIMCYFGHIFTLFGNPFLAFFFNLAVEVAYGVENNFKIFLRNHSYFLISLGELKLQYPKHFE